MALPLPSGFPLPHVYFFKISCSVPIPPDSPSPPAQEYAVGQWDHFCTPAPGWLHGAGGRWPALAFVLGAAGAGGVCRCWGGKGDSSFEVVCVSTVGMHWGIR